MKWLAIAMPLAFVFFLQLTTEILFGDSTKDWLASAIFFGFLAIGVFFFATVVFGWLDRSQKASEARAGELQALNDLGKTLTSTLDRDAVITNVLETAKDLLDARAVGISMHDSPDSAAMWRAIGEGKADLARVAADVQPTDAWERGSSPVLTDDGQAAEGTAAGKMTIHGKTHDVQVKYRVSRSGTSYQVSGNVPLNLNDYGIAVPSYFGITVQPDIDASASFTAERA